jgi:hypothetical protein
MLLMRITPLSWLLLALVILLQKVKEAITMKKISIIIKDGLIQEVFSNDPEVDIEIIDLDADDALELEYDQEVAMLNKTATKIY